MFHIIRALYKIIILERGQLEWKPNDETDNL